MNLLLRAAVLVASVNWLTGCSQSRTGGELRLKHSVTIMTAGGERTFSSVVSLNGLQTYNYGFGGSGWGGVSCRLTGEAVRVIVGDREFYFLLSRPRGSTPAWNQIGLVKTHFGLLSYTTDASWVEQWKVLARSSRSVDLLVGDYPAIAAMPLGGWMNDARLVSLKDAEEQGLHVLRYRLEITREPVSASPPLNVKYRPTGDGHPDVSIGRQLFSVVNGTA